MAQFHEGVLPYVSLDEDWQAEVLRAMTGEGEDGSDEQQRARVERALSNLRKQHL